MSDSVTKEVSKQFQELIKLIVQGAMLYKMNKKMIHEGLRKIEDFFTGSKKSPVEDGEYELRPAESGQKSTQGGTGPAVEPVEEATIAPVQDSEAQTGEVTGDHQQPGDTVAQPVQTQESAAGGQQPDEISVTQEDIAAQLEENQEILAARAGEAKKLIADGFNGSPTQTQYAAMAVVADGFEKNDLLGAEEQRQFGVQKGLALRGGQFADVEAAERHLEDKGVINPEKELEDLLNPKAKPDVALETEVQTEASETEAQVTTHTELAGDTTGVFGQVDGDGDLVEVEDGEVSPVSQDQLSEKGDALLPPKGQVEASLEQDTATDSMSAIQERGATVEQDKGLEPDSSLVAQAV